MHARPGKAFYDNRDVIAARDSGQCDVNINEDEGRGEERCAYSGFGSAIACIRPSGPERQREVIGPHTKRTHGENNREA